MNINLKSSPKLDVLRKLEAQGFEIECNAGTSRYYALVKEAFLATVRMEEIPAAYGRDTTKADFSDIRTLDAAGPTIETALKALSETFQEHATGNRYLVKPFSFPSNRNPFDDTEGYVLAQGTPEHGVKAKKIYTKLAADNY